jgi:hypothetical protein
VKYNSSALISAIKRNASIPSSQVRFSNTDFLKFLNEELQLTIVGELLALRQDYFVTTIDTLLIANQSNYEIPTSAVGWMLESVGYIDTSSNYTRLPIITRDQRANFQALTDATSPSAVYITGNTITTVPDLGTSTTGSLRFDLVRIQNELVLPTTCGEISTVADTGTDYQMTVDTVPIAVGARCDVISGTNPFNIIARNMVGNVLGNVITVTYGTSFARAPIAGDYVCITGQTPYPNIPEDFHAVLAQAATVRCMIASNDEKGIQTQGVSLGNMLKRMRDRASKRVSDAPRKIVGNNYLLSMMRWT